MKAPRFRIASIIVAVAIASIHFVAFPALLDPGIGGVLFVFGALPMADVLIVGILIARKRRGSRPFLLGFEVFGAIALALYIYLVTSSPRNAGGPLMSYVRLWDDPLRAAIGQNQPLAGIAIEVFVGVLMLVGPQLVFASIGGFLSRSVKVTTTRR